jgi:regulator of PEP synthase PpsR (kinase-PPPase family)
VHVIVMGNVRMVEQVEEVVRQAKESSGLLIHTLVDAHLRNALVALATQENVIAIDLVGELMTWMTEALGHDPLGQPGLYRKLRTTLAGASMDIRWLMTCKNTSWADAEIILVRYPARKTP